MKWKESLIEQVIKEFYKDEKWSNIAKDLENNKNIGVHLAVFNEPFLKLIFDEQKKIESRFSINKIAPYDKIYKGDIVILKKSGGYVYGAFLAGGINYFANLDGEELKNIEENYGKLICSKFSDNFWSTKEKAKYATLIGITMTKKLKPFKINKVDRSAWSVIRQKRTNELFEKTSI